MNLYRIISVLTRAAGVAAFCAFAALPATASAGTFPAEPPADARPRLDADQRACVREELRKMRSDAEPRSARVQERRRFSPDRLDRLGEGRSVGPLSTEERRERIEAFVEERRERRDERQARREERRQDRREALRVAAERCDIAVQ